MTAVHDSPQDAPSSIARQFTIQFLYQCESENIFYYSEPHFFQFVDHLQIKQKVALSTRKFVEGIFESLSEVDTKLASVSQNWQVKRMAATDRAILRLGMYEMLKSETPTKVVISEAVDLAKKFGSEQSGAFVNGLLDFAARKFR